jgi:hypothetical protein
MILVALRIDILRRQFLGTISDVDLVLLDFTEVLFGCL